MNWTGWDAQILTQPLPSLTLAAAGGSVLAYWLVRRLTARKTVSTDLSCGNVGRIKMKGPLESTLRLLGFDRLYDRPKPRADSIHVITSRDTMGLPRSQPWLRFSYVLIPDKPPERELPAWTAGSKVWKRMARLYNPSVDRSEVQRGEPRGEELTREGSIGVGRRAELIKDQVSDPHVNRLIRLGIARQAPTSSRYVNVDVCLETGTAAGVFSLAASELLARVQRRTLTTVTILSEPKRLGLVRSGASAVMDDVGSDNGQGGSSDDIERYLSNAILLVRDARAIFRSVDALIYVEQMEDERSKIDNVIGELKGIIYTAAVESLYSDIGNVRTVAEYNKILVPVKLKVTRVAGSLAITPEVVPLKCDDLEDVKVAGKPVFLFATVPPEQGVARLIDQLDHAILEVLQPRFIEKCLIVAPLPNPIAYLLVPLTYDEVDRTALGYAIRQAGYNGSEQYFRSERPAAVEVGAVTGTGSRTGPRIEGGRIKLR
jgi:hypothetical protein